MWDRWAIVAVGLLVALRAARWGLRLGAGGDWLAGAGGLLLAVIAAGLPLLLALLGPSPIR